MRVPEEPLLSVVVTARNDNHGGGMLRRMQTFVNALVAQCRRHSLPAELVVVEWNPPADRPRLLDALRWPADLGPCQVRIIEVPEYLHRRFSYSEALPLFQMIGKNVGIRRARGRFVLATNIDVLMNDELMAFLASGQMRPGRMYRLDRHDVMPDVPVDGPVEEQLRYCATHRLRVNAFEGTFPLTPGGERGLFPVDVARPGDGILFGEGWFSLERDQGRPFRWAGPEAALTLRPPARPHYLLGLEVGPGPNVDYRWFKLRVLDEAGRVVAKVSVRGQREVVLRLPLKPGESRRFRLQVLGGGVTGALDPRVLLYRVFRCRWVDPGQRPSRFLRAVRVGQRAWRLVQRNIPRLGEPGSLGRMGQGALRRIGEYCRRFHDRYTPVPACRYWLREAMRAFRLAAETPPLLIHTNAAGDFTLMAREHWLALRGNPEFEMFSLHIDSVMCYVAQYAGVTATVLPEPMRLYHIEHGKGWTPESADELLEQVTAKGIPVLTFDQVLDWAAQMRTQGRPILFNDVQWGLANATLPEAVVGEPARRAA